MKRTITMVLATLLIFSVLCGASAAEHQALSQKRGVVLTRETSHSNMVLMLKGDQIGTISLETVTDVQSGEKQRAIKLMVRDGKVRLDSYIDTNEVDSIITALNSIKESLSIPADRDYEYTTTNGIMFKVYDREIGIVPKEMSVGDGVTNVFFSIESLNEYIKAFEEVKTGMAELGN